MTHFTTVSSWLLFLIFLCFSYQIVYLFLPLFRRLRYRESAMKTRYAILIAARNEEAVLPHLLDSIRMQDYPAELVTTYVIADNCTDRTAAVATLHGARVYQRFNTRQVGKGYALNYLIEQLRHSGELNRFDAFLVFDADNLLQPDYIRQMDRVCAAGYQAFCGFRNSKNYGDSWVSSGHAIWYLHESTHMNRSRMLLGSCCSVSGTGFGFTRQLLERLGGWNFFTLTEDIEFRTWCATHGITIGYCHDAVLFDEQPVSLSLSVRQRTRWVQGGVQVSLRYWKDYLKGILRGGRCGWASFEYATQSLWGYGLSVCGWLLRVALTFTAAGWLGLGKALILTVFTGYASLFFSGAMTVLAERSRIHAGPRAVAASLFTYPVFMATYIPITVASFFRKREWKPIAHTAAVPITHLRQQKNRPA